MVTFPPHTVTFPWYFYKTTSRIKTTKIAWVLLFLPRWSKSKVAPSIIDASICLYDFQNRILYDMQNTFSFFSRLLQLLNMLSLPVYLNSPTLWPTQSNAVSHLSYWLTLIKMEDVSKK